VEDAFAGGQGPHRAVKPMMAMIMMTMMMMVITMMIMVVMMMISHCIHRQFALEDTTVNGFTLTGQPEAFDERYKL
jgi:hypothetical protein